MFSQKTRDRGNIVLALVSAVLFTYALTNPPPAPAEPSVANVGTSVGTGAQWVESWIDQ